MGIFKYCFILFLFLVVPSFCFAETTGDGATPGVDIPGKDPFYSQGHIQAPGLHGMIEHVDPQSGNLSVVHTDLYLPGVGGLDLKLVRAYDSAIWSKKEVDGYGTITDIYRKDPMGIGWRMHMGIVINPEGVGSEYVEEGVKSPLDSCWCISSIVYGMNYSPSFPPLS